MEDRSRDTESIIDRIRKLMAKAQGTTNAHEAEAFAAKAQELMFKYAISDLGVSDDDDRGVVRVQIKVPYLGKYYREKVYLVNRIAENNRCKAIYLTSDGIIELFGYPTDTLFVEMLYTNLVMEMYAHLMEAQEKVQSRTAKSETFQLAFCQGFTQRVAERLREQRKVNEQEATEEGNRNLPVLRKREVEVQDAFKTAHPKTGRIGIRNAEHGVGKGMGRKAGDRVDTGAVKIGGQGAIGRGLR